MRTMDVNGVWRSCMYREVMSEQELRAVPIEPPEEGTAAPVCASARGRTTVRMSTRPRAKNATMALTTTGRMTTAIAMKTTRTKTMKGEDERRVKTTAELLGAVRPLVARIFAQFRDVLEALLQRHPGAPVSEAIGAQVFLSGLARQVLGVVAPTLRRGVECGAGERDVAWRHG